MRFYGILDFSPENAKDFNQETIFGQHFLVCALQEMGCLLLNMGTMANNLISDNTCSKFRFCFVYLRTFYLLFFFRCYWNSFICYDTSKSSCSIVSCMVYTVCLYCLTKPMHSFNWSVYFIIILLKKK